MRYLKWISALMILALLCAMLPSAVAEDDLEIEGTGFEEFDCQAILPNCRIAFFQGAAVLKR